MSKVSGLPSTNEGYGTKEYWEERYIREGPSVTFDWFLTPAYLIPIIKRVFEAAGLQQNARILMLGCGNSTLSEEMYDAGYRNIVNVDYSGSLISQMKGKHKDRTGMEWIEADVTKLDFQDESFDVALDKGTMDAMLTTKGDPWNPPEKDILACTREVTEALRILKRRSSSRFLYFTFGQPHFRKRYMQGRESWDLTHEEIGPPEGFAYFMYQLAFKG